MDEKPLPPMPHLPPLRPLPERFRPPAPDGFLGRGPNPARKGPPPSARRRWLLLAAGLAAPVLLFYLWYGALTPCGALQRAVLRWELGQIQRQAAAERRDPSNFELAGLATDELLLASATRPMTQLECWQRLQARGWERVR